PRMEAMVMLADRIRAPSNSHGVKKRPSAVGTVAWIIIEPLILASVRRCLPRRTQMMAFITSGSSVATGLSNRAVTVEDKPSSATPPPGSRVHPACTEPHVVAGSLPMPDQGRRAHHSATDAARSEEHTSELQSRFDLVCR